MADDTAREVSGDAGLTLMLRAAVPALPVIGQLPGVRKASAEDFDGLSVRRPPVTVERGHVEQYAEVCGFPTKDTVPFTYPHLLGFPLHLAMMTEREFPAAAVGMVHVENSITGHRPLEIGETVEVSAAVGAPQPHPKGRTYDFTTQVRSGDTVVWESTSTYLRRGNGEPGASSGSSFPDAAPNGVVWRLPGDLGRRYAAVSGDRNPIHLYAVTAKAFGFSRQIAHGMWTLARCVAALENRLPDAARVDVAFKKPVLLPGSVAFGSTPVDQGYAFSLTSPKDGAPHLMGRTAAL
jgi:acyl dehydratase